jgi:hypothetical protein
MNAEAVRRKGRLEEADNFGFVLDQNNRRVL